jgi:hypothetical protein
MSQREAQTQLMRYSEINPQQFQEWKHIDYLFSYTNDSHTLMHYTSRKFTWFRYFQLYNNLKHSGTPYESINTEMLHRELERRQHIGIYLRKH